MKKNLLLTLVFTLITCIGLLGQTSNKTLNYQAVILDPKAIDIPGASIVGQPLSKGNVCLRFSLLNAQGGLDYEETQSVTTDEYGLVNVAIGAGAQAQASNSTSIYRSFDSILWNSSVKSLKVSVSYDGCSSFKQVSSQALNYTPYALYAEAVEYKNVRDAPTKLSQFSNDAGYLIPKDLDPLKNEITFNTGQIAAANQTIADNKKSSDAAFLIVNQSITSLDVKVAENTSSIGTINTKITDQQNQINDSRNQISATNAKITDQQNQINDSRNQISATNAKLTDQQNQINDSRNQITATNNSLNSQIGGLQTQINAESFIARTAELSLTQSLTAITNSLSSQTATITSNTNGLDLKANINNPIFTGVVAVGTTSPSASAVIEISSGSQGALLPRMTTSQRNNIITPSNALLIFNTTNNAFEVYKSACSCWVTINDGGNTAANNLVNTAPTANSLNYQGTFRPNGSAKILYTYADADGDIEGGTSFFWEIANDAYGASKTTLSTGATATFLANQAGKYVRAIVTPRATKGILNGNNYYGPWTLIDAESVPFASGVSLSGTLAQGSLLTGTYKFNGGSGTENGAGSNYTWQSATSSTGANAQTIALPDGFSAFDKTLVPTFTEITKFVRFGVNAKDNASLSSLNNYVYSDWVGPIILGQEAAPIAKNVTYNSNPTIDLPLNASYTYYDANNDAEGATAFQWYTATDAIGTGKLPISGATAKQFIPTTLQDGKYIGLGVTIKALTGTITGTEVVYYNPNPASAYAQYSIADNAISIGSNNFYTGRVMGATDNIIAKINVTSPGKLLFRTNTVNGYSFSADGSYPIGEQNVTLTGTGTQISYNSGGDKFDITITGRLTSAVLITISNTKLGNQFTSHFNGIVDNVHNTDNVNDATYYLKTSYTTGESFSSNNTCLTKPISTSACIGNSITVGSNTYSITNINGQCWMTQDLKELPNGKAITQNEWLQTSSIDKGYYGYFNTTTTNGSAGWSSTPSLTGEGLLYQWSAAMKGSTLERAQGICPTGWHIPSDCEYSYLEHGLGLALTQQAIMGNIVRGNADDQGVLYSKLGISSTNSTNFSAVLYGERRSQGDFAERSSGYNFQITSTQSSPSSSDYTTRVITSTWKNPLRRNDSKATAHSVRCIKD